MANEAIGYARLVDTYKLPARALATAARIDTATKGRNIDIRADAEVWHFEKKYRPEATLTADLQFALRYEGVNLEVLALLFEATGKTELQAWLKAQPESRYARRAGFLYEWLSGRALSAGVPAKAAYVTAIDEKLQFGRAGGVHDAKFRVIDNLPGTPRFCPLVRKTAYLRSMVDQDLKSRTRETLARYAPDLLRRAAAFLYLKETHSSFEVEHEKPSPDRARRFTDLLREAESDVPLSEERLVELQNAVVDARFHEGGWRSAQNWVGRDLGYRKKVDFVPARPEDLRELMAGLIEFSKLFRARPDAIDAIIAATSLAFGFVFAHPFMDGNGRLHRYLIHAVLAASGFTPKGIVLPVSAVILANLDDYVRVLERFSKPIMARTKYNPDVPAVPASGNDALYFRFFDATDQASFLYQALERTVMHDLGAEIDFLLGFDNARSKLGDLLDWPAHALDLFIKVVQQNANSLSIAKRRSHFAWMTDAEVARGEAIVADSFARTGSAD